MHLQLQKCGIKRVKEMLLTGLELNLEASLTLRLNYLAYQL